MYERRSVENLTLDITLSDKDFAKEQLGLLFNPWVIMNLILEL